MTFIVEQANPDLHYAALARFLNHFEPDPITAADLHEWDRRNIGNTLRRSIVRNKQDAVIGYSVVLHGSWNQPHEFFLWIAVDPAARRRGIGEQLYDHALGFVRANGGTTLTSEVGEEEVDGLRFAQRHGFTRGKHTFQSRLALGHFDEQMHRELVEAVQAQGIRLYSLADVADNEATRRQLYAINRQVSLQDPGSDGLFPPFEEFTQNVFAAPWYRPGGQWLAADGDQIIGMCAVGYFASSNSMYNMMTGVVEAYRGRGIAQALKVMAMRWAKTYSAAYIRTNNNSENAAMLAINRKLGYVPEPGLYTMTKPIRPADESVQTQ